MVCLQCHRMLALDVTWHSLRLWIWERQFPRLTGFLLWIQSRRGKNNVAHKVTVQAKEKRVGAAMERYSWSISKWECVLYFLFLNCIFSGLESLPNRRRKYRRQNIKVNKYNFRTLQEKVLSFYYMNATKAVVMPQSGVFFARVLYGVENL